MTQQHPITPPEHLVAQMIEQAFGPLGPAGLGNSEQLLGAFVMFAGEAAKWGADQELEACCQWLVSEGWFKYEHEAVEQLRTARRPDPPSLKQRALKGLAVMIENGHLAPDLAAEIRAVVEMAPDA